MKNVYRSITAIGSQLSSEHIKLYHLALDHIRDHNDYDQCLNILNRAQLDVNLIPPARDYAVIHHLAWWGDVLHLQEFLQEFPNADIDRKCQMSGLTALHIATKRNHLLFAEFLLNQGASRFIVDEKKRPPYWYAITDELSDLYMSLEPVPLRILTLNCYLVHPKVMEDREKSYCVRHEERGSGIGVLSSLYDIVSLQEVWGPATAQIKDSLSDSHHCFGPKSSGFGTLDTAIFFMKKTGGLFSITNKCISTVYENRHVFNFSKTKSQKGVTAKFFDVGAYWPGKMVLMINTHVDPLNTQNVINRQLRELIEFMEQVLEAIFAEQIYDPKNVAVFVCGDFNLDALSPASFRIVKDCLGEYAIDLYGQYCRDNNLPDEPTYDSSHNGMVFWDDMGRLDYIWNYTQFNDFIFANVEVIDAEIVRYTPQEELSDHYGVSLTLGVHRL
eukprot:TRINITY_DN8854_c0_g1_i1.p1 TRINITY_DN8854_c0_g1~~TRINITY_DN8854_c0_g1_i1.p1  ORF type:complete len:444 (+),score=71.87 TRINITY_DN8854_c0_g1_i1:39-1370(+)